MLAKDENNSLSSDPNSLEVVVGSFPSHLEANRVASSLRNLDVKLQRVSRRDPAVPNEMPEIVYEDIEEIGVADIAEGAFTGGAIGGASGLLLLGVPAVSTALVVAAPLAGLIAGAWIGAVAGIDEAKRGIELPNKKDYQQMLAEGMSFIVIAGNEEQRKDCGAKMAELGAVEVFQHPPILQAVRKVE